MWNGRKRLRPLPDTSFQEDEDEFQSKKFIRVRTRTRAPVNLERPKGELPKDSNNSTRLVGYKYHGSTSKDSPNAARRSSFAAVSSKKRSFVTFNKTSNDVALELFGGRKRNSYLTTEPPVMGDSDKNAAQNKGHESQDKKGSNFNKKQHFLETPKKIKKGHVPPFSYGQQTPEFMKVKEDESIVQEKKERKRRRHKIMTRRTAKGQPVMRGRIELMLEEIRENLTKK